MVAEHVVDLLDPDIVDSRIGKDAPRGISPGHPRGGGDLLVGLEGRGDAELRPKAQGQRRTDQEDVDFEVHDFGKFNITDTR